MITVVPLFSRLWTSKVPITSQLCCVIRTVIVIYV